MAKLAKDNSRRVIRLSKAANAPKAKQFLAHYFAVERPNTTHLFFSKGVLDFLLGLVIGIMAGIIITMMAL